uniref:Uncharacterized protein n=1 Tax=Arundo donax TaxID=35708 RepID=A0A0A9SX52_ARUDO
MANGIRRRAATTRVLEPRTSRREAKSGARWFWTLRSRMTGLSEMSRGRSGAAMPTQARKSSLGWSVLAGSMARTVGSLWTVAEMSDSEKP